MIKLELTFEPVMDSLLLHIGAFGTFWWPCTFIALMWNMISILEQTKSVTMIWNKTERILQTFHLTFWKFWILKEWEKQEGSRHLKKVNNWILTVLNLKIESHENSSETFKIIIAVKLKWEHMNSNRLLIKVCSFSYQFCKCNASNAHQKKCNSLKKSLCGKW